MIFQRGLHNRGKMEGTDPCLLAHGGRMREHLSQTCPIETTGCLHFLSPAEIQICKQVLPSLQAEGRDI